MHGHIAFFVPCYIGIVSEFCKLCSFICNRGCIVEFKAEFIKNSNIRPLGIECYGICIGKKCVFGKKLAAFCKWKTYKILSVTVNHFHKVADSCFCRINRICGILNAVVIPCRNNNVYCLWYPPEADIIDSHCLLCNSVKELPLVNHCDGSNLCSMRGITNLTVAVDIDNLTPLTGCTCINI